MPRYFFTTVSERFAAGDDEGLDLADTDAVRKLACAALADLFAAESDQDHGQSFSVSATDERGDTLLTATLSLTVHERQRD